MMSFRDVVKSPFHAVGLDLRRYSEGEAKKWSWLREMQIDTVLDIGANVGQFARHIRSVLPRARIVSFEPLRACYDELMRSMRDDEHFSARNFALGTKNEDVEIHRHKFTASSSILPMAMLHSDAFPYTKGHTMEKVSVKRLDDVYPDLDVRGRTMLKIDVQGFELEVIRGGTKSLSMASVVIIETSFRRLYEDQPLFADVLAETSKLGLVCEGAMDQLRDPRTGRVLQADTIFVRSGSD